MLLSGINIGQSGIQQQFLILEFKERIYFFIFLEGC